MFYLILALIAASAMSLVLKQAGRTGRSSEAILLVNYVSATGFSLLSLFTYLCGRKPRSL